MLKVRSSHTHVHPLGAVSVCPIGRFGVARFLTCQGAGAPCPGPASRFLSATAKEGVGAAGARVWEDIFARGLASLCGGLPGRQMHTSSACIYTGVYLGGGAFGSDGGLVWGLAESGPTRGWRARLRGFRLSIAHRLNSDPMSVYFGEVGQVWEDYRRVWFRGDPDEMWASLTHMWFRGDLGHGLARLAISGAASSQALSRRHSDAREGSAAGNLPAASTAVEQQEGLDPQVGVLVDHAVGCG